MKHYSIQLMDILSGRTIDGSGGKAYVAKAGDAQKETLYNKAGGSLANPISLVNGKLDFYVADSVVTVDLYIQAPSGHFVVAKGVVPSGETILVNKGELETIYTIPFAAADTTATVETNTGFPIPAGAMVLPTGVGINVSTADATETVDLGTLSTDSGDADGFIVGASVATVGTVKASLANGATTLGALLFVQDSANAGDKAPEANVSMGGKFITYTLSAGTDTAEGFFRLPVQLPQASA